MSSVVDTALNQFGLSQEPNGTLQFPKTNAVPLIVSSFMMTGLATLIALLWQSAFSALLTPTSSSSGSNGSSDPNNISTQQKKQLVERSFRLAFYATMLAIAAMIALASLFNFFRRRHRF